LGLLKGSYGPARGKVTVVTDIEVTSLDIDMATHLGMISGELISNCLKHAFPDGEDGTIMVNVSRARLGMIQLMVQDNGIGLPHGFDLEEVDSVGLRLVKAIVRQMSGTFELNPGESGAGFRIVLPTNGAGH
jgi:two-component sensor histidine kinase